MDAGKLILHELPTLSLQDSGDRALLLMNEYKVFHLPLVDRDNYLALISEDDILDWDTPEMTLSHAEFVTFRPAVFEKSHPSEAVKIANQHVLSVLPVVDEHNHYVGSITEEKLFYFMSDNNGIKEQGAVIVLLIEPRNYSLSEIARICESNNITILATTLKTIDKGFLEVTLKINANETQALEATFERFNYTIKELYTKDNREEYTQDNFDSLMRYLSI
jgi:CBS domain-containing protein